PQPDEAIRVTHIAKLTNERHPGSFLGLDELSLEERNQSFAFAWNKRVLSKFNYRTARPRAGGAFHEFHSPISFPRFAAVFGEGLLPMRLGGKIRPQKANANRFPSESILSVKGSHTVFESADHRRIEMTGGTTVKPPDRPLSFRRIVSTQRQGAISVTWKIENVLIHVPRAVQNLLHHARP